MAAAALLSPLLALACFAQTETGYWTRVYPPPAYFEIWHLSLKVPDLKKAMAKSLSIVAKRGGSAVVETENMASSRAAKYQQLSFRIPVKNAAKALRSLQDLGAVQALHKNPGFDPGLYDDIPQKLATLREESNAVPLDQAPGIKALTAEFIAHLEDVSRKRKEAVGRILLNLELREAERDNP